VQEDALNQIDLSVNYSKAGAGDKFANVQDDVNQCVRLRAQYLAASWWGKLGISSSETRPPAYLFDDITVNVIDKDSQLTPALWQTWTGATRSAPRNPTNTPNASCAR